jgi:hypothetical protein
MATKRHHLNFAGGLAAAVALALAAGALLPSAAPRPLPQIPAGALREDEDLDGYVATLRRNPPGTIELAVLRESVRPGSRAPIRFWSAARGVTIQVFRVGAERTPTVGNLSMQGVRFTPARRLGDVGAGRTASVWVGRWPSGLYFVRATAPGGRLGYAPFVVRPATLGEHRVAVVLPTRTWQAYNFRDDDGDLRGDTWYANQRHTTALLIRPFLNRGVPPHYRQYDVKFLHWLHDTHRGVDILSQAELDGTTGARLARAYDLIVFPGHHEYVTRGEYDAVEGFRDRGGNLVFLSANNFYWRIDLRGNVMTRVDQWRDLGRPEAALIGAQYIGNDMGEHRGPWLVRDWAADSWLFAGVKLGHGNEFSDAGIEIDATARSSPRGTHVVAQIPDLLGPGMTAQMTYYETRGGARVFAAGAFTLAGSLRQPAVRQLLDNIWQQLANEREPQGAAD